MTRPDLDELRHLLTNLRRMSAAGEPVQHGHLKEGLRECFQNEGPGVLQRMREAYRKGVGKEWRAA